MYGTPVTAVAASWSIHCWSARSMPIGTEHDFLTIDEPPFLTDAIITNPPYGENRRGELAIAFIAHALALKVPRIAMLLRDDFDCAITRQHLFRNEPRFAFKLVLLEPD